MTPSTFVNVPRPDLSSVDPDVKVYIEALESRLAKLTGRDEPKHVSVVVPSAPSLPAEPEPLDPAEPASTLNLITVSAFGIIKRVPRHLYQRQRRGGVGFTDFIPSIAEDYPAVLCVADQSQSLLVFTNLARAFRLPVSKISETQLRSQGSPISSFIPIEKGERVVSILPIQAAGYFALASETGLVRILRHHLFSESMKPGTAFFSHKDSGDLAAVCWTPGQGGDIFLASHNGSGIRFSEKSVEPNPKGAPGIRLGKSDQIVSLTPVDEDSHVFLISADGKGALRQMSGFAVNKAPGGSGKQTMKSDRVVGSVTVESSDDLILASRSGKVIRFKADEVPESEGVVQGVIAMGFRFDEVTAVVRATPAPRL